MNKRQKIVVSITGITLVLLILVGLTYAYFLTRIQGNTNTKSISVTTADLALVYADGVPDILIGDRIQPDNTKPVGNKKFTVTNEGNKETDYIVVMDDVLIKVAGTETTTTFESNDFVYTLSCVSKNKNTNEVSGTCNGVSTETTLPLTNNSILVSNSVPENIRHEYVLTVTYKETNINQSNDMNKILEAKVNIKDIRTINPYQSGTLAYSIIDNSVKKTNGTELRSVPLTKVAEEISASTEKELSITNDDYGTSYYYRGSVTDNYVDFAGLCWRIVRIQGDGSVKLVLASKNGVCETSSNLTENSAYIGTGDYGYDNSSMADYENTANRTSSQKYIMNQFLNGGTVGSTTYTAFSASDLTKLKSEEACISDTTKGYTSNGTLMTEQEKASAIENYQMVYYDAFKRLAMDNMHSPSLKCNGTKVSASKVYPLTADEIVFAGGKVVSANSKYYLNENATTNYWWSLSPAYFSSDGDFAMGVSNYGFISNYFVSDGDASVRPAVSLVSGAQISSGDGTQGNPYKLQ